MKKLILGLVIAVSSLATAYATPVTYTGDILNASQYTLVHRLSGSVLFWFDDNQDFTFDYDADTGIITAAPQVFSLHGSSGAATLHLLDFSVTVLPDGNIADGGYMYYHLGDANGPIAGGNFVFNTLTSGPFNRVYPPDNGYLWGGDDANDLGIDFAWTVPEPSALVLLVMGLLAVRFARRRI